MKFTYLNEFHNIRILLLEIRITLNELNSHRSHYPSHKVISLIYFFLRGKYLEIFKIYGNCNYY